MKNKIKLNKIYCENCLNTMKRMPDNFIDLTVTSPPYDNLRDYNGYEFDFETIAKELYRVTKQGGVVVWVVGDQTINGSETLTSCKQKIFFREECGFNIHDTMIYEKNGPSYPSQNRYYQVFEYMFILIKNKIKTFNPLRDRKNRFAKQRWSEKRTRRRQDGTLYRRLEINTDTNEYGMRFNIWKINTGAGYSTKDEMAFEHPAIFPERLAADHIYSWSNEGDLVYDPMVGSGTTVKMAIKLKRNWIASEISEEYCKIVEKRIEPFLLQKSFL